MRFARAALAVAIVQVVAEGARAASTASDAALPFADLPDIRINYRWIAGATVPELSASLEASAEHPPGGGSSYADTRWSIRWHWRGAGAGASCRVRSVEMIFGATITLPQLLDADALDPQTRARWSAFARAISLHEAGHARRAHAHVATVRRAILASSCDDADAAGRAALRPLYAAQAAYDRATRNGAVQGAHFP